MSDVEVPAPMGHVVGFVDTAKACQGIIQSLIRSGVSLQRILMVSGDDRREFLNRFLVGYQWGEEVQKMISEGARERQEGHVILCVDADDRDEGMRIAQIASAQGGHGFVHFGEFVDERLTR